MATMPMEATNAATSNGRTASTAPGGRPAEAPSRKEVATTAENSIGRNCTAHRRDRLRERWPEHYDALTLHLISRQCTFWGESSENYSSHDDYSPSNLTEGVLFPEDQP